MDESHAAQSIDRRRWGVSFVANIAIYSYQIIFIYLLFYFLLQMHGQLRSELVCPQVKKKTDWFSFEKKILTESSFCLLVRTQKRYIRSVYVNIQYRANRIYIDIDFVFIGSYRCRCRCHKSLQHAISRFCFWSMNCENILHNNDSISFYVF